MRCIGIAALLLGLSIADYAKKTKFEHEAYRLADVVKSEKIRDRQREYYHMAFNGSIGQEYIERAGGDCNITLLVDILREREEEVNSPPDENNNDFPSENLLVIHLRIGDVIDGIGHSVDDFLDRDMSFFNDMYFVKPIAYYEKVIEELRDEESPSHNISGVALVGGFHMKGSTNKSYAYVEGISRFFQSNNFTVEERIDNNAGDAQYDLQPL